VSLVRGDSTHLHVKRVAKTRLCLECLITASFATAHLNPAFAAGAAINLQPKFSPALLDALRASPLVGSATKPIAAFSWTIEYTRPLAKPKLSRETYTPIAINGLAQSQVETLNEPNAKPLVGEPRPSYTVRGLERVQETDAQLSFSAPGLTVPPVPGKQFELNFVYEQKNVTQQCSVGQPYAASKVLATIPGNVTPLTCNGKTKYLGMNVSAVSTLLYFDALALFFNETQDIQSPLGPVQLKKKITDFALAK
jgi:hypothetical protein